MGILALDSALSGLRIAQQQINVISTNVSNVGTPGYSRKILPQSSQAINGVSVGVRPETIIRNVDINLERDLWTQVSRVGFYDVQASYLNQIEAFHGPPDAGLSIASEISNLRDGFLALSDSPENSFLQSSLVNQATDTARKINDLSDLITTLRNDAQDEIALTVNRINDLLEQIGALNDQIESQVNIGRSTALTEDKRSGAIQELSELIDISFFQRGDGVIVVQTNQGLELASDRVTRLSFNPTPQSAQTYYPDSASGIFVGDPGVGSTAFDITERTPGGKLGGLIALRDETFPKQMAQLDEMAHKLALRMDAQGLRLFTDASGNIPADTAPDPATILLPAVPVEYVGFSATIQVNANVLADPSLVQSGTYGATLSSGSNEVISRIISFGFTSVDYQQAEGITGLQVDLTAAGALPGDLQDYLGITSTNLINTTVDLTQYGSVADILTAGGAEFDDGTDQFDRFTITYQDPDLGNPARTITIDLSAIVDNPALNAAEELEAAIEGDALWATIQAEYNADLSVGSTGQLVFESRGDVVIASAGVEPISNAGFAFLGISSGTYTAEDPYFDIQVGSNNSTQITIGPADTAATLLAALQAVPGLGVEDFTASADGFLRMRPGDDYTNPDFGGGIKIISGPFTSTGATSGVPNGINLISSLFGSYDVGPPIQDQAPISNITYGSETNGLLLPPIPTTSFRTNFLGPRANISTEVIGASSLIEFSQKMVNQHTQELILVNERNADENTLRTILNDQLLNESGVNLDEELGHLIVVQTAYAAAARVISAVDELFVELLNAVS